MCVCGVGGVGGGGGVGLLGQVLRPVPSLMVRLGT